MRLTLSKNRSEFSCVVGDVVVPIFFHLRQKFLKRLRFVELQRPDPALLINLLHSGSMTPQVPGVNNG